MSWSPQKGWPEDVVLLLPETRRACLVHIQHEESCRKGCNSQPLSNPKNQHNHIETVVWRYAETSFPCGRHSKTSPKSKSCKKTTNKQESSRSEIMIFFYQGKSKRDSSKHIYEENYPTDSCDKVFELHVLGSIVNSTIWVTWTSSLYNTQDSSNKKKVS